MSLVKGKRKVNTILDFSDHKLSKNKIKESLRFLEIIQSHSYKNNLTIFDNFVKVGTYNIKLVLQENFDNKPKKLRECGKFQIRLFEQDKEINLKKDYRFINQDWIKANADHSFKIRDLVNAILYCSKLNSLKLFL